MKIRLFACIFVCLATPLHALPLAWSRTANVGISQDDANSRMTRDAGGNIIVAGYTDAGTNGTADILVTKYATNGAQLWQRTYHGRTNNNDYAGGVGTDAQGNIYVVGTSVITSTHREIVLLKYEPDGDLAWQRFEANGAGTSWTGGNVLAVDAAGNTAFPTSRPSPGYTFPVIWIVSYDSSGQVRWAQYGFSDVYISHAWPDTSVRDIIFGPDGTVYICGEWRADLSSQDTHPTAGWGSISSNGTRLWAIKRRILPANYWVSAANDIGFAPDGSLYVCGSETWSENVYRGQGFLYRLDPATGMPLWYKIFVHSGSDGTQTHAMAFDGLGHVITVGASNESSDYRRAKVIQWNCSDGAEQWRRDYNRGPSEDYFALIDVDSANNVVIAGSTSTQTNNGTLDVTKLDISVVRFDPTGVFLDATHFDGAAALRDSPTSILLDPLDNIHIAGFTTGIGTGFDALLLKYAGREDTTTDPPTLSSPANGSVAAHSLNISFTLPEPALAGSVKLIFDDGVASRELTLAASQQTSGAHAFTFDPANPLLAPEIASGPALPDGTYAVRVSYQDSLGNPAAHSAAATGVELDTTVPAAGSFAPLPASPVNATTGVTLQATGWADPHGPLAYQFFLGATPLSAPGTSASFAMLPLPAGNYQFSVRVFDALGNFASAGPLAFLVDGTAPTISTPGPLIVQATGPDGAIVGFTLSATDDLDPNPTVQATPASGSTFPIGTTTVRFTARDWVGNMATGSFTLTVQDTIAPALDLPANIIADATSAAGAVVNFSVTATDAVDASPTIIAVPTSGSIFPIATTTVNASATDDFGNTRAGSFTVTVRGSTTPSITGPFSPLSLFAGTPLPDYAAQATVSNMVGTVSVSQRPDAGSMTYHGELLVTLTARDAAGNTLKTSFVLTVISSTPETTTRFSKGDAVPGEPAGTTFVNFGVPAINDEGDVAFATTMKTPAGNVPAIFDGRAIVARKGGLAEGAGGAVFASFKDPVFNAAGSIAFQATLSGPGATAARNTGLWTNAGGTWTLLARKGTEPPGVPGGKFRVFESIAITETGAIAFTASLQSGAGSVTAASDVGLWLWTSAGGAELLLREGQSFPAFHPALTPVTVRTFDALESIAGSPGHGRAAWDSSVFVRIVFTANDLVGLYELSPGGGIERIETANLAGQSGFSELSIPSANRDGNIAVLGRTAGTAAAYGIFADDFIPSVPPSQLLPVPLSFIALQGDSVSPLAPVAFRSFGNPVMNAERHVAFHGTLAGPGVTALNQTGIWWTGNGRGSLPPLPLFEVARKGGEPPGLSRARWKSFDSLALPDGMGPLFSATLLAGAGGVTSASDTSLWAIDSRGILQLLVREGQIIGGRKVRTITALSSVAGSFGQTRSFNSNWQIVYRLTFTDGSQAICIADLP